MKNLLLLPLVCLLAIASDPKVAGGPFVVNVATRTATIAWLVFDNEVTVQPPGVVAPVKSPAFHIEKTTLTGLTPNTRYEYEVPGDTGGKASFKTAPSATAVTAKIPAPAITGAAAPATAVPFQFIAYGDNRTRPAIHQRVIHGILAHGIPDFILQTGDLVADGDDSSLWTTFFSIERDLLRQTAIFPALGNHEHNSRQYYDLFQRDKGYYSFDWGDAHFAVINSDIANVSKVESVRTAYWEEETHWLEEDLKSHQTSDYRFVACHHPPFTAVASRQGDNPHITALTPMLEKYNVTAGFFGHDHNYQHYLKNGIHYLVSGGGGAPLYDVDKPPASITVKVASVENFVAVSVDGKTAHVQVITIDGKVLDEFDLHGTSQPASKPASVPVAATVAK